VETKHWRADIPGLVQRLSTSLYPVHLVALRELIQNANDACLLADGLHAAGPGRIDVNLKKDQSLLEIVDTGIGMRLSDLEEYLTVIAKSPKAKQRRELERNGYKKAKGIAGEFGIGFLSAFIIAGRVEVLTRHIEDTGPGYHWISTGDGDYQIGLCERPLPVGTTVRLHVKPEYPELFNPATVSAALLRDCPFIATKYHINGANIALNHRLPPWDSRSTPADVAGFLRNVFEVNEILGFRLQHSGPVTITSGDHAGTCVDSLDVGGYFAIPEQQYVGRFCGPAVYTCGLLVGQIADGLPDWCKFVVGAIECPDLDLTLGRDDVMKDSKWAAARQVVEEQLIEQLSDGLRDPRKPIRRLWKKIFSVHQETIMTSAIDDRKHGSGRFFGAVKDIVPFRLNKEHDAAVTIDEFLRDSRWEKDGVKYVFYYSTGGLQRGQGEQERIIFEEKDIPFIYAPNWYERDFLELAAQESSSSYRLLSVTDGVRYILDYNDVPEEQDALVKGIYEGLGLRARLCRFRPAHLAAAIVPVEPDDLIASQNPNTPGGRAAIIAAIATSFPSPERYTLCLNLENQLITRLVDYAGRFGVDPTIQNAFQQVYDQALLLFGDEYTMRALPGRLSNLMLSFFDRLFEQDEQLQRARKSLSDAHARLRECEERYCRPGGPANKVGLIQVAGTATPEWADDLGRELKRHNLECEALDPVSLSSADLETFAKRTRTFRAFVGCLSEPTPDLAARTFPLFGVLRLLGLPLYTIVSERTAGTYGFGRDGIWIGKEHRVPGNDIAKCLRAVNEIVASIVHGGDAAAGGAHESVS
jgi:HSP90 family molecular chaperone